MSSNSIIDIQRQIEELDALQLISLMYNEDGNTFYCQVCMNHQSCNQCDTCEEENICYYCCGEGDSFEAYDGTKFWTCQSCFEEQHNVVNEEECDVKDDVKDDVKYDVKDDVKDDIKDDVKPCKCGSTTHKRTSSKKCPLYKKKVKLCYDSPCVMEYDSDEDEYEKCVLCDGYYAKYGDDDHLYDIEDYTHSCHLCGKVKNLVCFKLDGSYICGGPCDEDSDEDSDCD